MEFETFLTEPKTYVCLPQGVDKKDDIVSSSVRMSQDS